MSEIGQIAGEMVIVVGGVFDTEEPDPVICVRRDMFSHTFS